jgi:hypothetical protein
MYSAVVIREEDEADGWATGCLLKTDVGCGNCLQRRQEYEYEERRRTI